VEKLHESSMVDIQHFNRIASKRSGLSLHLIRVWEKRYRAVTPSRTTNRRLYGEEEIASASGLLGLVTKAGHTLKNAVKLATEDLRTLVDTQLAGSAHQTGDWRGYGVGSSPAKGYLGQWLLAIKALNRPGPVKVLNGAAVELGRSALLQQTLTPLIEEIGCSMPLVKMASHHRHHPYRPVA
jgi:hypothetical protein